MTEANLKEPAERWLALFKKLDQIAPDLSEELYQLTESGAPNRPDADFMYGAQIIVPARWTLDPAHTARRIALLVAGENALPVVELENYMKSLGKYTLDAGNNWWLHPDKDGDRTKWTLNYRYSQKWPESKWIALKETIEMLL